ncbi:alpha/beta fold hydrolase [Kaistia adipata]|uniref:alpha/beta fold hydrolase n=1 Tax=Kaistia adipata TaxID=166954 RepID=UPI0004177B8B|nr:alpha/beta fold hydrolase [Kaistia adipata]
MIVSEYTLPGMHIRDHVIPVPLDWSNPAGPAIQLFAREVVDPARKFEDLPLLCFLQGGPGGKSPRPTGNSPGWLHEALKTYRVVLPDQRGTGRSTPVTSGTMARFADGEAAADHLQLFLADSIVADLEHLRNSAFGGKRWQTLGQSYGGFLTLTYLSHAPEALTACYITGGLPGLGTSAAQTYQHTYPRVAAKNAAFYKRFPQNIARVADIADRLEERTPTLPDGDRLTVRRLQMLGIDFGLKLGFENTHWLLDEALDDAAQSGLSALFIRSVCDGTSFASNPLYAVLQEAIYAGDEPTAWSAEQQRPALFCSSARPLLFTGEMMFPWMYDDIAALRPFKAGAEALARRKNERRFYDSAKLAANAVPVAAAIYHDDMYVDAELSLQTARHVGNLDYWITNEFEHDGLRQSGSVLTRLVGMVGDKGGPLLGSPS